MRARRPAPFGLGLVVMLHCLPFHRSMNVFEAAAPATNWVPAARQRSGSCTRLPRAATARAARAGGAGQGDDRPRVPVPGLDQCLLPARDASVADGEAARRARGTTRPRMCSRSVWGSRRPTRSCRSIAGPTQWQPIGPPRSRRVALGHDTPLSWLAEAPVGMALVAVVDAAPVGVVSTKAAPVASAITVATASARPPMMPPVAHADDAFSRLSCARRTPAYAPLLRRDRRLPGGMRASSMRCESMRCDRGGRGCRVCVRSPERRPRHRSCRCTNCCSATGIPSPSPAPRPGRRATGGRCSRSSPTCSTIRSRASRCTRARSGCSIRSCASSARPAPASPSASQFVFSQHCKSCRTAGMRRGEDRGDPALVGRATASRRSSARCSPTPTRSPTTRAACPTACSPRCAPASPTRRSSSSPTSLRCTRCTR